MSDSGNAPLEDSFEGLSLRSLEGHIAPAEDQALEYSVSQGLQSGELAQLLARDGLDTGVSLLAANAIADAGASEAGSFGGAERVVGPGGSEVGSGAADKFDLNEIMNCSVPLPRPPRQNSGRTGGVRPEEDEEIEPGHSASASSLQPEVPPARGKPPTPARTLTPKSNASLAAPAPAPAQGRDEWHHVEAPQKTPATVSMIDCLWEKVSKVSDCVDALRGETDGLRSTVATLPSPADTPRRDDLAELEQKARNELKAELATVHEEFAEAKTASRAVSGLAEQLAALEATCKEHRERSAREARAALESLEQRMEQRIATVVQERVRAAILEAELVKDVALDKLRTTFRQQLEEQSDRQDESARQLKRLVAQQEDAVSAAAAEVRRLEQGLQSMSEEHTLRQQSLTNTTQQLQQSFDRLSSQSEQLASQQAKATKSAEASQRTLEETEPKIREVEASAAELHRELQRLGRRLEDQSKESLARSDEVASQFAASKQQSQSAAQQLQHLSDELQARGQEAACLRKELHTQLSQLTAEAANRERGQLQEMLKALSSLEERSNANLEMGLKKLGSEVADRLDREEEKQRVRGAAAAAAEKRFSGHLENCHSRLLAAESWHAAHQEREAAQEQRIASLANSVQRLDDSCQEIPRLESRLEEARATVREDLAASAVNSLKGEMRLWAKMAQMSGSAAPGPALAPMAAWQAPGTAGAQGSLQ